MTRRTPIIAGLLIASLAAMWIVSRRVHKSLLDLAAPLDMPCPEMSIVTYEWVDGHSYVANDEANSERALALVTFTSNDANSGTSATVKPVATTSTAFFSHNARVSSDGHWCLWSTQSGTVLLATRPASPVTITVLPGRRPVGNGSGGYPGAAFRRPIPSIPTFYVDSVAWMPGAQMWLDIEPAGSRRALVLRTLSGKSYGRALLDASLINPEILGVTDGHIAVIKAEPDRIAAVDVSAAFGKTRDWSGYAPSGAMHWVARVSADGRRLFWWATFPKLGDNVRNLAWSPFRDQPTMTQCLAVVDLHTGRKHIISQDEIAEFGKLAYRGFRWMPDSRHITFTHNGTLYSIAID